MTTTAEAFISRTVAGHPQLILPDLIGLDEVMQFTSVILMHHTDCGALTYSDESIRSKIKERLPQHQHREVDEMKYGGLQNKWSIKEDVKKDVAWVRNNELIREELRSNVIGCLYNIETGIVESVDMPSY